VDELDDWLDGPLRRRSPAPGSAARRGRLQRARGELRRATAGLLFLRNKLEAEQTERRVRMARACHAILRAARDDDDDTALPLMAYRDALREQLCRAEEELAGVRTQAADAKDALARLARAIERDAPAPRRRAGGAR
jgi:hypothetical protein